MAGVASLALVIWALSSEKPERLRDQAEAATRAGDWASALKDWRRVNQTRLARGRTHLAEARACLALDRAGEAENALQRAIAADPSDPEPWRLLLELLRVEDRTEEAQRLGWEGYAEVSPAARRGLLRDLTLALLADLPEDLARSMLDRWTTADPADIHAQVARLKRIAAMPRQGDPDRDTQIATLSELVERNPRQLAAREALVSALAEAGEPDRGRQILDTWPADARDSSLYARLQGRWDLDYDHQPARAITAFERVLAVMPQDWKTRYRLARALQTLGRHDEARQAAEAVSRLREHLDPSTLGPRLGAALARLDDPRSLSDLVKLCDQANLSRLAEAWRREATAPSAPSQSAEDPASGILEFPVMPSGSIRPR